MLDALPPPLVGFARPAIIRPATPDLLHGMLPGLTPAIAPRRRPQFVGTTPLFTTDPANVVDVNVGPNFVKRVHFGVSWSAGTNRTLDTVLFGGNACSRQTRAIGSSAGSNMEWWSIETAATSGDLALDWSGSITGGIAAIFWSPRTGAITNTPVIFSDVASGTVLTTTIDTYAGGYLLAGVRFEAPETTTWTGAMVAFDSAYQSFAWLPVTAAQTGRTITATLSGTASFRRMAVLAVQ